VSRTIDADILTKLESKEFRPFHLLHMSIDGTDYRYTDCDVPLYVTIGDELITNGDFANWTGDDPDDWTVSGESGSDPMITEAAGQCRLYTSGVYVSIRQDGITTAGKKYKVTMDISAMVSGSLKIQWIGGATLTTVTSTGSKSLNIICDGTGFIIGRNSVGNPNDVTFDNVSVKRIEEYTPRGFQFQPASYSSGRIVDRVQIEMENLDSVMTSIFVDGTPQDSDVTLMMCIVDDDGTLVSAGADEIVLFDGQIDYWVLDEEKLKVTITSALSKWSQKTLSKHPKSCRWKKFKGTECAYAGGETWCDRTYARCIALSNTANYGGFRFLPSLVDKVIWWGRSPDYK